MRIRTVKPEFWRSEDIAQLSREDRLLFIGLWQYVDDNGVGIDDYRLIAGDLFALEEDQTEVRGYVRDGLATLSRALLITRYEADGKRLLHITTWAKHQRVDRPNKPRFPLPVDVSPPVTSEDGPPREDVANDSRDHPETPSSGTEEQRNRGRKNVRGEEPPREDVDRLCRHLYERVTRQGSKASITADWRREARLLLDRDGRPEEEAHKLIDWCQDDSFWHRNVLSMPTFRKQYDKLRLQARDEPQRALRAVGGGEYPRMTGTFQDPHTGTIFER